MSFQYAARDFVARIVPVSARVAVRRRLRGQRATTPGAPPGMSTAEVDELCVERVGERAERVSYLQISGWRKSTTGAFRVDVSLVNGGEWKFYCKNSVLNAEETPGLAGLPKVPGSEFSVYATAPQHLSSYLAEVYSLTEIEPGVSFRIVLEDLKSSGFKMTVSDREILSGVQALPDVHQALREWTDGQSAPLFRYDRDFSTDLRELTLQALERWNAEKPTRSVSTLLSNWELVERIQGDSAVFDPGLESPVHGDANRANVLVREVGSETEVKLIDWEWTGWRIPHFDLASLTKGRSQSLTEQAVEQFSASDTSLSLGDHRALYLLALLDLRLLDASYVVAQHFGAPGAARMDIERYLHISVTEILSTIDEIDRSA